MYRIGKIILIIILLFISVNIYSQNFVILDIQVIGNERIDRNLIISTSGLKIGDMFSADMVGHSIRSLYQLYVFEDVNIEIEEIERGLRVIIIVEELPVVGRYSYEGSKALSRNKLEELGVLRIGSYWSEILQRENSRRILEEYKNKGYNLANLDYRVAELSETASSRSKKQIKKDARAGFSLPDLLGNEVDVRVRVEEGKKVVIRSINFHGNDDVPSKKLLGRLKTKKRGFLRSGKKDEEKFADDQERIIDFYHKDGYIDARIVKIDESIVDGRFLIIDIYIEEGEQFFVGSIDIQGNQFFEKSDLLKRFTLYEGDVFDLDKFNKQLGTDTRQSKYFSLTSMYFEEGYIYMNYDTRMNRVGNKVYVTVMIEENTRAKIHKIHISGNTKTKEKVIRRQLNIAPGDYFRRSRIIRSQQNIYNLGFFEPDIGLDYSPINHEGDVDIYLSLTDKASGSANVGIGYNSRDNLIGTMSLSLNNAFGNYWQTGISWETSGSHNNIELSFTNPYFYDTDVLMGFSVFNTRRNWTDANYRVHTTGGSVRFGYPIKALDFTRVGLGYSLYSKEYKIRNHEIPVSQTLQELDSAGWQNTSAVNLTLSRDSRDNIFFPTTGSRIVLYSEVAGGPFGGDFNYFKQIGEISWFTPLFSIQTTESDWTTALRTKWRMGYITGYGKDDTVPPDERFMLGGTGASGIRGYPDRSIGPREGGTREVLFSSELGIPIASDQIIGVMFIDTGNCYNKFSEMNLMDFETGAGLGIRIRTPMGLMGFDFGYSFKNKEWEPHFQFGTTF